MPINVDAIYEDGVLKPLQPLPLSEHQKVRITLDEGPTWAPNGRVLMFSREGANGASKLWSVDVTGRILQPMPYPGAGSDPAWSPLLN